MLVRIEIEIAEQVERCLSGCLDIALGLDAGFDFDELADAVDGVECDGESIERIAFALLSDGRGRVESERFGDRSHRLAVGDARLELLARLGLVLDERSFVGDPRFRLSASALLADAEGFVRRGEIAVGHVVVGVDLFDAVDVVRAECVESLADALDVGFDLYLDLVHTREFPALNKSHPFSAQRNVVLKSAKRDRRTMSNDSEAEEADVDDVEEDVENETADEETEGLQNGDFIELDYTAWTVEGEQLVDTTDAEVAEEEGVGEDQEFGPRTIVLGQGHIFEAVEDDIVGKEVGDSGTVVVPAAEAFGEYDEEEVRTVSANKIPEDDRYPGGHVDIDGEHGHVETIIGGRARVDFNHPLAGEDIEYEYEILREIEDREEKASGLIQMFLDMELDVWFETDTVEEEQLVEPDEDDEDAEPETETVEVEKDTLYIEATPQLTMNQQWMMGKQQIAQQLTQQLDVDRIIVQEEIGGGGMMGGMGGMMGGMGGGDVDIEEAVEDMDLDDEDIDADEIVEELEDAGE